MTLPSSRNRPLCAFAALLLCALCVAVDGFNVDVKNCIRHRGPEGSMFGFSVAQHKERGRSWLLIGAPEAQTDQPGVEKGGAVYKCGTARENDCEEVPFDTRGNNNSTRSIQIDKKSRQWFGATVSSSGDNGVVLACAPRYVYFTSTGSRRDPVGTCYTTRDFNDFSEYSPCRTRNWGHHKQGTCQAGLGASVSKDGRRLFIGAVGSWYWQGQLYSVDSRARLPFIPAIQYVFNDLDEGQVYSQSLYSRPEVLSTNEGPPTDDDSYLGYSVAVGTFGANSESGSAVGMPRGEGLLGKVLLYSTNLTNLYNITGDQMGAYFGYSICVSDVDGDGGDDIIVGAPLYSEFTKNDGSYETGRVYVYLKQEGYRFYERNTRIGFNSKSRFGLALATLGDINRDGFGDFAVGAPYDGPNELGAVYIYHGTRSGVREKYSQVIRSEDVSYGRPVSTFGFSLAGGIDLDNNQYPDLIVGAYESDTVYYMKSRPVAQMANTVNFMSASKQISLEKKECTTRDGSAVPCLFLNTCLQYTGIGVDDQMNIELQLVLDAKKPKAPRMFFLFEENRNVLNHSLTLDKNVQSCKRFNVYLMNNVRDKLTPLEAELRYRIIEDTRKFTRTSLTPVIDLDNELFAVSRDSIIIQKNCGDDNVCIPDLRLIAKPNVDSFLLGSSDKLKVEVIVQNEGEDSFETSFDMTVPQGINFVKIERVDDNENEIPVQCSAPSVATNHTLHCDIGNPLPRSRYVQFRVVLEPYQTTETKARYDFQMAVNSTNPENPDSVSDNTKYLGVPLWVETDLIVEGSSKPVDVHYNTTVEDTVDVTEEKQIGPQVIHLYGIRNKGPSDILEAEAYIDWPLFTLAGEPLLYLLEMPETNGPVKCEAIEEINPLKIKIDRSRKSYFESSGLISSGAAAATTFKGQSSGSVSSGSGSTGTKVVTELTEEEKRRLWEIQRKDEEAAKTEYGEGSYVQNTRFNTGGTASVGGQRGVVEGSKVDVNRGSSGSSHSVYESSGSSVYTETSQTGGQGVVQSGGQSVQSGSSDFGVGGGHTAVGSSGVVTQYGAYGAAHFGGTATSGGGTATSGGKTWDTSGSSLNSASGGQGVYGKGWESAAAASSSGGSAIDSSAAHSGVRTQQEQWEYENRGKGVQGGGGWTRDGGNWGAAGGKNFSTFHETQKSVVTNTTWGDGDAAKTYVQNNWRTNDDGYVRNGSSVRVESGAIDYNDALNRINKAGGGGGGSGVTNVVTSIPGDDSDLSLSLSTVDEQHSNKGFKQSKVDETETVQRWRTVDGKLYKVNNVDDWRSLITKDDASTQVYDAQLYDPQNLRKPPTNPGGQDVDGKFKLYTRFKREASQVKQCGPTRCATVKCKIGPLSKDQEVWLSFRSRAWVNTLKKVALNRPVTLSSTISSRVTKLPYIGKPDNQLAQVRSHEVFTQVVPRDLGVKPDIIPLWIVVLAAVAGTAILLLLVYLLYKCGFFKRNRPSNAPEKQPLTHRNGQSELYQTGDEAL